MKKRIFSIVMSAMLVGSLSIASVSAAVPTGGLGEALSDIDVDVDMSVKNPVYKIDVPTTYDFAVDPFEQMNEGSQIASSDYYVINKSNVNVTTDISFKLSIDSAASASLAANKSSYVSATHSKGYLDICSSPSAIDKDKNAASLWIGAAAAYNVTPVNAATATTTLNLSSSDTITAEVYINNDVSSDIKAFKSGLTLTGYDKATTGGNIGNMTYDNNGAFAYNDITGVSDAKYWADTTSGDGKENALKDLTNTSPNVVNIGTEAKKMTLALAKANSVEVYTDATATTSVQATGSATTGGVTSFRLIGAANPNYKWATGLLELKVSYNFNGIAASDYTALQYVGSDTTGKTGFSKMVKGSASATATSSFDSGTGVLTFSNIAEYDDIKISNGSNSYSLAEITPAMGTLSPTGHPSTGTLTLSSAWKSAATSIEFVKGSDSVYKWTKS